MSDTLVLLDRVKDQSDQVVFLADDEVVETLLVEPVPPSTGVELDTAVVDEVTILSDLVVISEVLEALEVLEMLGMLEVAEEGTVAKEVSGTCGTLEIEKPEVSITGYDVVTVDGMSEDKSSGVDREG